MKLLRIPMGCLSSRSTIAPSERVEIANQKLDTLDQNNQDSYPAPANSEFAPNMRTTMNFYRKDSDPGNIEATTKPAEDDIMSMMMNDRMKMSDSKNILSVPGEDMEVELTDYNQETNTGRSESTFAKMRESLGEIIDGDRGKSDFADEDKNELDDSAENEPNMELLRQYVAVDFEITILEDRDALRIYHEKIEKLERLEQELDMIGTEAEEAAVRGETDAQSDKLVPSSAKEDRKVENENNSINGLTDSILHQTWLPGKQANIEVQSGTNDNKQGTKSNKKNDSIADTQELDTRQLNKLSFSTIEDVFNRKIILEKERDRLKKEVEMVIVECDKLQQRYKKRDEILDKLFDGKTGNELENHLEQQLNWLLEQKHYVDQVFYAWKRAETLTSQTCEQFASAIELLERMPKIKDPVQRAELAKSIENILIKSRQDMEQAQKYNPNVDAPFFTDNETKRFDKIIETISPSNTIDPAEYNQVLTVIQFAYKRAVNIRFWLEQILQTTIARDSFELSEEYKWIAIQLRKERINLMKSKLQEPIYQSMVQSIQEEVSRQQTIMDRRQQHEINRDSGIESEINDIDIEDEIYRLLDKVHLDGNFAHTMGPGYSDPSKPSQPSEQLKVSQNIAFSSASSSDSNTHERIAQDQIQERVKDVQSIRSSQVNPTRLEDDSTKVGERSVNSTGTPIKLKIKLNEKERQSLLKKVDQSHSQHRSRIEILRHNNKVKTNNFIRDRIQQAKAASQPQTDN